MGPNVILDMNSTRIIMRSNLEQGQADHADWIIRIKRILLTRTQAARNEPTKRVLFKEHAVSEFLRGLKSSVIVTC